MKEKYTNTATVKIVGKRYLAFDINGNDVTDEISQTLRSRALKGKHQLGLLNGKWHQITPTKTEVNKILKDTDMSNTSQNDTMALIHGADKVKPKTLIMSPLKWKYLVRSAIRGKNIMMTGPAGCGKTQATSALAKALNRPYFPFNLGSTQDPRTALIGNTQFKEGQGTFFNQSTFIKAIQTKDAVILLDELSRAHPEAWNILMPVLDQGQRFLRIDEQENTPVINVAEGVTFVATANIGNEYTSTRVIDRALMDRFVILEMDVLNKDQELKLLTMMYPNVQEDRLKNVAEIAHLTREELKTENSKISTHISTRIVLEIASLLYDGFTLNEACEACVYPFFSADGGADSERTFVKQIVQKFIDDESSNDLFNLEDITTDENDPNRW